MEGIRFVPSKSTHNLRKRCENKNRKPEHLIQPSFSLLAESRVCLHIKISPVLGELLKVKKKIKSPNDPYLPGKLPRGTSSFLLLPCALPCTCHFTELKDGRRSFHGEYNLPPQLSGWHYGIPGAESQRPAPFLAVCVLTPCLLTSHSAASTWSLSSLPSRLYVLCFHGEGILFSIGATWFQSFQDYTQANKQNVPPPPKTCLGIM